MTISKILVATDFSSRSDRAVRRSVLLAREFGAAVDLVHVIDNDQPERILKPEREVAADVIREIVGGLRSVDGVACEGGVIEGEPFEALADAAVARGADLVIVGPHRRQALKDIFVGTTAERTIRASSRPVLMANGVPAGPYRRILVAVDLSEESAAALEAIRALGMDASGAVSVLHVPDAPAAGLMRHGNVDGEDIDAYVLDQEKQAARALNEFLLRIGFDPASTLVRNGGPSTAEVIADVAAEVEADLIVVGTKARKGLARMLLGSVAEEVLRMSERDVLAIPPRA